VKNKLFAEVACQKHTQNFHDFFLICPAAAMEALWFNT